MSAVIAIKRAAPLTTIQDEGRFGMLRHGISAAGPMDRSAFAHAGWLAGGGRGGVEFTAAGLELQITDGRCRIGLAGGQFVARHNEQVVGWPATIELEAGDRLLITPGSDGNYGYVRFDQDIVAQPVLGSIATSMRVHLGGLDGRALRAGDVIALEPSSQAKPRLPVPNVATGPIGVTWGIHADLFSPVVRQRFTEAAFTITPRLDRMGVQLSDPQNVFAGAARLSLVSDAIVHGDIQILGDGTPIVLMRDHQPTGGYARIATVISAHLDRFCQLRPGSAVTFQPVTVEHAQDLLRSQPG